MALTVEGIGVILCSSRSVYFQIGRESHQGLVELLQPSEQWGVVVESVHCGRHGGTQVEW